MTAGAACPLCSEPGGHLLVADQRLRVIRVADANFPAFYRVVWQAHVAEWSDLSAADRLHTMDVVVAIERVLREALAPTKINLAALGNVVPHLHWHVVARFDWDSHFPQPIWGEAQREVAPDAISRLRQPLSELDAQVRQALQPLGLM